HGEGFRADRPRGILAVRARRQSQVRRGDARGADCLHQAQGRRVELRLSGAATPHHLFMAMFLKMIGASAQHVPYRGSAAALADVISRHIPMMIVDLAVAIPAINEGKVKAFGVTSTTRIKALPDLPTIAEAGVPGYGGTPWFSVVAPAGTPRPIIDKLNHLL